MSQNQVDTIALFKKLITATNNDDSKLVIDSSNAILQTLPDDIDAQKCKIIAYINMGKYDEAIKVIDKSANDFYIERVYCLYLKQKYEEALELLNKRNTDDKNSKLLKAQILYRLDRFDESVELYRDMANYEEYDYLTNISACYLLSNHLAEGASLLEKYANSTSYEVLYNYGTLLIYSDKLEEAEKVLLRALQVGRKELHDGDELELDIAESGDEAELDPIRIQLSYVWIKLGKKDQSEKILVHVLSHGNSSRIISTIATSNMIALHGCNEMTESVKKLRSISADIFAKLTCHQQNAIRFNRALLLLMMNREFETIVNEMTDKEEIAVLHGCELIVRNKEDEAIQLIESSLSNCSSVEHYFLLLQLLLNHQQYEKALQLMTQLPSSLLQTKGVQSLFYAVCRNMQNQRIVDDLITEMEKQPSVHTLQATAEYFFESHQYDLAADRLRNLLTTSLDAQQRIEITSELVLATTHTSIEEASRLASELPEVPIIQDIDMNEVEEMLKRRDFLKKTATTEAAAALTPNSVQEAMEQEPEQDDALANIRKLVFEAEKRKKASLKKRARKTARFIAKLKSEGRFRESNQLDPERWLAKEDRTPTRRSGKKMTVSATGIGAQGEHLSQAEVNKYDARERSKNPEVVHKVRKDTTGLRRKKGGKRR